MTPLELIDRVTALLEASDYLAAEALLTDHSWPLLARLSDAQRQELDALAQLVQGGRDATMATASPTAERIAAR